MHCVSLGRACAVLPPVSCYTLVRTPRRLFGGCPALSFTSNLLAQLRCPIQNAFLIFYWGGGGAAQYCLSPVNYLPSCIALSRMPCNSLGGATQHRLSQVTYLPTCIVLSGTPCNSFLGGGALPNTLFDQYPTCSVALLYPTRLFNFFIRGGLPNTLFHQ